MARSSEVRDKPSLATYISLDLLEPREPLYMLALPRLLETIGIFRNHYGYESVSPLKLF